MNIIFISQPSNMQIKKQNFIDEMKSRLNAYHLEKIKLIQLKPQFQQLNREQSKLRDALIEVDDDLQSESSFISNEMEDIKGWRSNRVGFEQRIGSQKINFYKQKFPRNTHKIQSANVYPQRNPNIIPYLKGVLERLQSPKERREVKTEVKSRKQENEKEKIKIQEPNFQLKKSRVQLRTIQTGRTHQKRPERAKFQTIDLNSENRLFPPQPLKCSNDYQKIKRKNPSQYEIDIAHQKQILHQLIRGTTRDQNNNYFSQRNSLQRNKRPSTNEKFTLKNLLY